MAKPKRDPEAPVPITASVPIEAMTDEAIADLLPMAIVANRCETCEHWLRLTVQRTPTSFGTCHRWDKLLVEDRGGVQTTPFTPTTPSHALCSEFSK